MIRDRHQLQQVKDFSGLRFGKISPTDIDTLLEFSNRLFVLVELKHGTAKPPRGQELAFERLCDALQQAGKISFVLLASHSGEGDIDVAACSVVRFRYQGKWRKPIQPLSVKQAIEILHNRYLN